jgi:hypothetical protein
VSIQGHLSRFHFPVRLTAPLIACAIVIALATAGGLAQRTGRKISGGSKSTAGGTNNPTRGTKKTTRTLKRSPNLQDPLAGETPGVPIGGELGIQRTTAEIMQAQLTAPPSSRPPMKPEHEMPNRDNRLQNPDAKPVASTPDAEAALRGVGIHGANSPILAAPQTLSTNFTGATLADTGAFPPDSMGTVGPSQYIAFENGRIRSFTKAGVADGVMNLDPDVFFASVMTPVSPPVVLNFTSDPQIRYDRFTARWYLSIIDVPCTNAGCTTTAPNRWMVAVSDAASNGVITGATVWTFFQFQADPGTNFCDYPSLGTDVNALYVGCNMFNNTGTTFIGANGYVVQKTSVLGAGPIVVNAFPNMVAGAAGAGPESPRGVDNFDPTATEGYFVGPDNQFFSQIAFRRISNPGSATPTISANIIVVVSLTTAPTRVPHLGNTGGNSGQLDSIDDRFFQAMIRNGRMWAAHNFLTTNAGVAGAGGQTRNSTRWYEFTNLTTTPTLVQSGTVFDSAATAAAARQYFIPSVVVTGQGHAVLAMTMAGTPVGATPAFVGRLAGDTLGTMDGPPATAAVTFGTTTANYNPPSDPGGANGRRWGDYSFTVVDPIDDMTVWTIQEFNQALNSYAVRVAKILAPPPATPSSVVTGEAVPTTVPQGRPAYFVTVNGTVVSGSGFYDPGANLPPPALAFSHVNVTFNGAGAPTVIPGTIEFLSPTQLRLKVNTVGAALGSYTVTVTNPDGQALTSATPLLTVVGPTAAPATISGRITMPDGAPMAGVTMNLNGGRDAKTITDADGNYSFAGIDTDNFYAVTPSRVNYHFSPANRSFSLLANKTDAVFTGTLDTVIGGNAIDSADYFVRQHYVDFLGREPDQSGFNFWSDQILSCGNDASCLEVKRINVSAAFFLSIEFQNTGVLVDGLYRASFGRRANFAEFMPDTAIVAKGVIVGTNPNWAEVLQANKEAFVAAWVARPAFQAAYGGLSNGDFVDTLISHTGGAFNGDRGALVSGLNNATLTRAAALRQIAENEGFASAKRNETFVMTQYFGFLRRDPDAAGLAFWLNKLNQFHGNFVQAEMVKAFLVSGEYRQRFGQ